MKRKREDEDNKSLFSKTKKSLNNIDNETEEENLPLPFPLPYELHLELMDYLPISDLASVAQTCKKAHEIGETNHLWKKFALKEGINEKILQETQRPVKQLVKEAKILNDLYPQDLIALMGGIDNIVALPIVPRKNVSLIFTDIDELLLELKGHKIWRGVSIQGNKSSPYIVLCTKQYSNESDPELGLILIFDAFGQKSVNYLTKFCNVMQSDSNQYFNIDFLKALIAGKSCEDFGIVFLDGQSKFELTDQTEFNKRNTQCIVS